MTPGGQSVGFVAISQGTPGYLGLGAETRTSTSVTGCLFQPLSAQETADLGIDVSTIVYRCYAPAVSAALNASPNGELTFAGATYQIIGPPEPKHDFAGDVDHVEILCKRQSG